MKQVIYLLLFANVAFFGWNMLQAQQQEARSLPALPVTAKPLVTLQEMEQKEKQANGQPQTEEPVPDAESATEPEAMPPQEQLAMLESLTQLQPPGGGGAVTCRTLGPITIVEHLKSLSSRLDELGLEPRHRISEQQDITGYWVYLPSMKYTEAMEVKGVLDKKGDSEYYIGKDNFVSLGNFNEVSRAEVRKQQVSRLGLDAVIEPRYKLQTVHWLDIDRQSSDAIDLGVVMAEFPGIKLKEQACY